MDDVAKSFLVEKGDVAEEGKFVHIKFFDDDSKEYYRLPDDQDRVKPYDKISIYRPTQRVSSLSQAFDVRIKCAELEIQLSLIVYILSCSQLIVR